MKKEKIIRVFFRYEGKPIQAKREVPYEIRLQARLMMDVVCFQFNKARLEEDLNIALEEGDKSAFQQLSGEYKHYIWK